MLRKLVEQYLLAFPGEKERLEPLIELLAHATEQEAMSRSHKVGHITASGFVISMSRCHLLLIHHKKLQRLLQPGGHMEPADATPLSAARREIAEETHLTSLELIAYHADDQVPFDIDIHSIPARGDEPEHLHHDFRFLFHCQDESEILLNENESELTPGTRFPNCWSLNPIGGSNQSLNEHSATTFVHQVFFARTVVLARNAPKTDNSSEVEWMI